MLDPAQVTDLRRRILRDSKKPADDRLRRDAPPHS